MRSERGFTLIELLVVIAILAVLFGATALALAGVGDNAQSAAANGERDVVQTAIDVCDTLSSCTIQAAPASGTCAQIASATSGIGTYLRRTTQFYYDWNATTGALTQAIDNTCAAIP